MQQKKDRAILQHLQQPCHRHPPPPMMMMMKARHLHLTLVPPLPHHIIEPTSPSPQDDAKVTPSSVSDQQVRKLCIIAPGGRVMLAYSPIPCPGYQYRHLVPDYRSSDLVWFSTLLSWGYFFLCCWWRFTNSKEPSPSLPSLHHVCGTS